MRVPGHENVGKPKPKAKDHRNWQQKTRDFLNEKGRKYLGPHAPSLGLLGAASEFTDAADLRDAMDYGGKMGGAVERGDWWGAAGAAPWMLMATGAAMLPGASLGAADEAAQKIDDVWYHGSPVDVYSTPENGFRLNPGESGVPALWGIRDPFAAEAYSRGEMALRYDDTLGKFPLEKSYYPDMSGGGVYGLRSKAQNPLEYDAGGAQWFEVPQGKIMREALANGHDAVIFKNISDNYQKSGLTSDVIAWLNPAAFEADKIGGGRSETGIRAYHGSPHDFDKFDMSKIGTGEGAQAYGHGLYFAESEGVARSYRDALTQAEKAGNLTQAGQAELSARLQSAYAAMAEKLGMSIDDVAAIDNSTADEILSEMRSVALSDGRDWFEFPQGRMYEVRINADPDTFLDWDKPLSEQPEAVRKAIEATRGKLPPNAYDDLGGDYSLLYNPENRPGQFLNTLEAIGGRPDAGEQLLKEQGIPGIKYLDAGSRGAVDTNNIRGSLSMWETALKKTPNDPYAQQQVASLRQQLADAERQATRNYVVFDDRLVSIVKKYGIAGASAILGYNILSSMDPAQAAELQRIDGQRQGSGW